ncbi:MAG: phosphomannomutase, partial [Halieaceae bacterium]
NFPNPEEPGAMDAVLALARAQQTTLACANDPDADRLAVAVRESDGNYQLLSGDAVGILLADYLLSKEHSFIPIVCTTIVSSSMLGAVAAAAGALYRETLTGFKWLANVALALEDEHHKFLFAYEEALGYAPGGQVRDKDGLSALLAFAQMTAELERRGSSVQEHLKTLFREHGIFLTDQRSLALDRGAVPIGELLRASPPERIGGQLVMQIDDLKAGTRYNVDGTMELLEFPSSDVLIFRLESGARIIVRPSGTEPKVKCYYEVRESVGDEEFRVGMLRAEVALAGLVVEHQNSLAALIEAANP